MLFAVIPSAVLFFRYKCPRDRRSLSVAPSRHKFLGFGRSHRIFERMPEEDLYIEVKDASGEVFIAADFRPFIPELTEYAERFGLTLRQAAESAVANFLENAIINPAEVLDLLKRDPWVFQFALEGGGKVEVSMADYAAEIKDMAKGVGCTLKKAAEAVLLANADELRPRLRWIEKDESE